MLQFQRMDELARGPSLGYN